MKPFIEKEIKILDIDIHELTEKLEKFGAQKGFSGAIHDIYYDTQDRQLEQQKKRLRIRQTGTTILITMKKKLKSTTLSENEEEEIAVSDKATAEALMQSYGFVPIREKKKVRITYTYHTVHFDIDLYEGIPPVLEIEAENEATISAWIKKLGLEKKTTATYGSRGLFKAYNKAYQEL